MSSKTWWAIGGTVFALGAAAVGGLMLWAKTVSIGDTCSGISITAGNAIDGFIPDPPHLPLVHPADDSYDPKKLSVKSNITEDGFLTVTARLKGAVATAHAVPAWKKNRVLAANWISYQLFLALQTRIPQEDIAEAFAERLVLQDIQHRVEGMMT